MGNEKKNEVKENTYLGAETTALLVATSFLGHHRAVVKVMAFSLDVLISSKFIIRYIIIPHNTTISPANSQAEPQL